jgi:hypothetical protein
MQEQSLPRAHRVQKTIVQEKYRVQNTPVESPTSEIFSTTAHELKLRSPPVAFEWISLSILALRRAMYASRPGRSSRNDPSLAWRAASTWRRGIGLEPTTCTTEGAPNCTTEGAPHLYYGGSPPPVIRREPTTCTTEGSEPSRSK